MRFSSSQACSITGCAPKNLNNWIDRGIITKSYKLPGPGRRYRYFDLYEIIKLRVMIMLGDLLPPSGARKIAEMVADRERRRFPNTKKGVLLVTKAGFSWACVSDLPEIAPAITSCALIVNADAIIEDVKARALAEIN